MKQGHHCPYLGLKHNRAIRFASPTPEHRCYVSGEPQEIPVDQARYCLSSNHIRCPLYTGEMLASIVPVTKRQGGVGGWVRNLSPRDRTIYGALVGLLGVILIIYGIGAYLLWANTPGGIVSGNSATPTTNESPVPPTAGEGPIAENGTPTATDGADPLPTALLSPTPSPQPVITAITAVTNVIVVISATPEPTGTPTPTEPGSTAEPSPTVTALPPTTTDAPASATPRPTRATTTAVPQLPTTTASATPTAQPTQQPSATPSQEEPPGPLVDVITLYFADPSGELLVPVMRSVEPTNRWRTAAMEELLLGPSGRLQRLLPEGTELLGLGISGNLATVNISKTPGSTAALQSIVLALTERTDVTRVQIQVNGANISNNPQFRPNVNSDNPQGLPGDFSSTEFLPLYFPLRDAPYYVRITRLVPKTTTVARETIQGLIDGPGQYGNQLSHPIPAGTTINANGLRLEGGTLHVDFNAAFAEAGDRRSAVDTLLLSLTTFSSIDRVAITVNGSSLGELWGPEYGGPLGRPGLNAE